MQPIFILSLLRSPPCKTDQKFCFLLAGCPQIANLNEPLVDATIYVYSTITSQLLPTPAKSHYTFNLRDLSKVFQGMLVADPAKIVVSAVFITLAGLPTKKDL